MKVLRRYLLRILAWRQHAVPIVFFLFPLEHAVTVPQDTWPLHSTFFPVLHYKVARSPDVAV